MDVWQESQLAQNRRIAGLTIRPFAFHHAFALMMLDSPLLTEKPCSWSDYLTLLLICHDDYARRLVTLDRFGRSRWLRFRVGWHSWHERQRLSIALQCADYLATYLRAPEIWRTKDARRSKVPWPFRVVYNLATAIPSLSLAEAWDMPINEGACLCACTAEEQGRELVGNEVEDAKKAIAEAKLKFAQAERN
jgi:hypothetical protein